MAKKKETGPYAKRGLYEISGETIKRRANLCPRCGPGVFMATHSDNKPRESCSRCGYTEYKR